MLWNAKNGKVDLNGTDMSYVSFGKGRKIYLETHTNLEAAIQIYEKCVYKQIAKPESVVHGTMNRFYLKELCDGGSNA